ncbi:putative permease (Major facilitator superfamily) [Candidatus Zixiibacteriota bacterium]|nr:putative permease (Major facilitator superfamily) [candidate division Zixibacteria bacterium]
MPILRNVKFIASYMSPVPKKLNKPLNTFLFRRFSRTFLDYWWHIRLFSKNVRLFLLGTFLVAMTTACGQLLFNLYLKERGADESFIGTFLSAGALGTAIVAIPAAFVMRRIRLKMILIFSTVIYAMTVFLISRFTIGNFIILISLISGMALTFNRIAAAPFFMRNSSPRERTYIFSFNFGVTLIAGMIGSLASGWMVEQLSKRLPEIIKAYQWTFIAAVSLGLLALIPFSLLSPASPGREDKEADFSWTHMKKKARLYAKILTPQFMVGMGAGLIIPFLNLYFRDRFGQPPDKIGLFFFAVNATMLIGILAGPLMARKLGMVRTIVLTELLSIPFMMILAFTYSLPLAFMAFLMRGALMNMAQPLGSNLSMELVSKAEHALVNALLTLAWTGSWMISTAIGGHLIDRYGYTLPLLIAVGLYIISAILYYLFFRGTERNAGRGYMVEMN